MQFLILLLYIFLLTGGSFGIPQEEDQVSVGVVTGRVVNVDVTLMYVDGSGVITIKTDEGERYVIYVPARRGTCKAEGLSVIHDLTENDVLQVRGKVFEGSVIEVCEEKDFYLRKIIHE